MVGCKIRAPKSDRAEFPDVLLRGGERWRASYALNPAKSRGRIHPDRDNGMRSPFQRDRDRIIHSNAFRRLKHKTQVFLYHEGDHYRTRLTHTLEVAQVARSIARLLGLNEDLTEAVALAHDLGHPPFGHAGEAVLDDVMKACGGFDHNIQSLRIVTKLEKRYPNFNGLNLTVETLDGMAKHNGPVPGMESGKHVSTWLADLYSTDLKAFSAAHHGSMEAQAAAISDDIAYASHDIEDGLRAGLLQIEELRETPITDRILSDIETDYPNLDLRRKIHEITRRLITLLIEDVVVESWAKLQRYSDPGIEVVYEAGQALSEFSDSMTSEIDHLKAFLFSRLYRQEAVDKPVKAASDLLRRLFRHYLEFPDRLPGAWGDELKSASDPKRARMVADYIAGMTDRFALLEFERLFDAKPTFS